MPEFNLNVPVDLSEKTTDKLELVKKIVHLITVVSGLLTICIVGPLVAIEGRYLGAAKAGPGYCLFVAIVSLPIPFLLVYLPWMYEKYNKFKRLGKFCLKNRTNIIFCTFNSFLWATASIAITVHSNDASNCAFNPDFIKNYGDAYTSSWGTQCNLGKVSAGFAWITTILWLVTLIITGIAFWKEKTVIQQRLNEHRLNKQQKLEERQEDVGHHDIDGYGRAHDYDEDASPFADQHYPSHTPQTQHYTPQPQHYDQQYESSPFADPHRDDYRRTSHTPVFDGQSIPAGQYVDRHHTPVAFSPMPEPQHIPPHPEPTHYNNHFN